MRVLVCGGGVIGASIAYFLSCRGAAVTIVERTGVACAASGKSGGFLALDWCDGSPLEPLARRSFALHASLPDQIGGDWGYRRMTAYSGIAQMRDPPRRAPGDRQLKWLSSNVVLDRRLGSTATAAQVHPARFTEALLRAAQARGTELRIGEVTGLLHHPGGGAVRGVVVDGGTIEADAVVIAMGPWSILAAQWLPLPGIYGLKGHSIVFDTADKVPAEALFLEHEDAEGGASSPEVFPRPDGTTYVCGISSTSPLPLDPADVAPDAGAIEQLHGICLQVSPALAEAKIVAAQACYRPVTQDGLPLIGAVPGIHGAYVATGHSVWGILNAPATGEAVTELIMDGAALSVDLSPFAPGRLRPLHAA